MDSSPSLERDMPAFESETSSLVYLLESGLHCIQQGRFAEGLTFFALVREILSPSQAHLAVVLDVLTRSHEAYTLAQEELLQASKHFVGADAERRKQLNALARHLTVMQEEEDRISLNGSSRLSNVSDNQSSHASQLQSIHFDKKQLWSPQLPQQNPEDNKDNQSLPPPSSEQRATLPPLYITCFGRFEVKRPVEPVILCPNRAGQTILRYLVAQSEHCATSDTLMALLWPEDEPELAQPRLHTAICALRRSLNADYVSKSGTGYIICKNRMYYLNPAIPIQTDAEQFLYYYQLGRQSGKERISLY